MLFFHDKLTKKFKEVIFKEKKYWWKIVMHLILKIKPINRMRNFHYFLNYRYILKFNIMIKQHQLIKESFIIFNLI